ncbi:hypothetical protein MKW98_018941 [Papaver atlanticum]|uniref:Uncharacterized protein n=1 Tax=Papaver atlanticum TaxID=357466 RepID=A0AAD4XXB6_9MAGN|nr:hypothetical protein MKW98_018941 [Papaver atlanticum]
MVVKSHYKKIINECQANMVELNGRLKMSEEKTSRCVCCYDGSHLQKARPNSGNARNNHANTSLVRKNGSPLRRTNVGEIVAEAVIADTDPKKLIHGMPIGFGAYKVSVTAYTISYQNMSAKISKI